jgi:ribose 5-phosphate isomerase B
MKVSIARDHAGVEYADILKEVVRQKGHELVHLDPDIVFEDYPDAAELLAMAIVQGRTDRGILLCGSGVGVSIAANKYPGVRAAVCHDSYSAHQGVEHDRMNILCIGERVIGPELAKEITGIFLDAEPSDEVRHVRRSAMIDEIEKRNFK